MTGLTSLVNIKLVFIKLAKVLGAIFLTISAIFLTIGAMSLIAFATLSVLIKGCNIIGTESYRLSKVFAEAELNEIHFTSDHIDLDDVEVCILHPYGDEISGDGDKIKKVNHAIEKAGLNAGMGSWYLIFWREDYFEYYRMARTSVDSAYWAAGTGIHEVFSELNFIPANCVEIKNSVFMRYQTHPTHNQYIAFGVIK